VLIAVWIALPEILQSHDYAADLTAKDHALARAPSGKNRLNLLDALRQNFLGTCMHNYPLMKKDRLTNVITFTWGSLPVDALNPQTMSELQMIASRKGKTIEQVMSEALDWFLVPHRKLTPARQ